MHILQIIKGLDIGGVNGGADKFGVELAQSLSQMGEMVTLVALHRHNSIYEHTCLEKLAKSKVDVLFLSQNNSTKLFSTIWKLRSFCSSNDIRVIHSHFQIGSVIALILAMFSNRLLVRTAHISKEWGSSFFAWGCRLIFTNMIFPLVFTKEVGVSKGITSQLNHNLIRGLKGNKALTIYNGLPEVFINAAQKAENNSGQYEEKRFFVIGSIGQLTKRKGYYYFFEAIRQLNDESNKLKVIIVGEGKEKASLVRQVARLGLTDCVDFVGQQGDVIPWLKKMDLFVLPSLVEGFPTVLLESMACGVPVIASNISGTRELVKTGETGWLVSPRNIPELALTIKSAIADKNARNYYSNQGRLFAKNFSIRIAAQKYQKLYYDSVSKV